MASYTIAAGDVAKHAFTQAAATVDTVTLTGYTRAVVVISDGAAAAYYTVDNTTPTVGGVNTYLLPAGTISADTRRISSVNGDGVLKFISAGTPTLSVQKE